MIALNLDKSTHRILSAYTVFNDIYPDGTPLVDTLPEKNINDYRYENGEFVYDPLPRVTGDTSAIFGPYKPTERSVSK
nr:MAG TPA: hypothetical protein [Bacteriophage sp.]